MVSIPCLLAGHKWKQTTPPERDQYGQEKRTCSRCGKVQVNGWAPFEDVWFDELPRESKEKR